MKNLKSRRVLYVVLSVVALVLSALPIIFGDGVAMTKYSIISLTLAICSVIYAVIAFAYKNKGNLFVAGRFWFYSLLSLTFSKKESYANDEKYKMEFELSAFVYCVTIPAYITIAFFAKGFYSALSQAIGWSIVRVLATMIIVVVPPLINGIKEKKQQRLKDEADRKEQERLESMGSWR